ncbi:MAG TPA: flotillin family protein [Verrucomicrobiae bacterium]|nr:flotillin family protein [Verrucomicrobiae bacterium]
MNPQILPIVAGGAFVLVTIVLMIIVLSRYTKVGPNQVLIVSGRKIHLPDGRVVGCRIVKGGGTFVFPVIEKVDVLSLEVFSVETPRWRVPTVGGQAVQVDYAAQLKIHGDDASIMAAAECFLSKNPAEVKSIVQLVLERHLGGVFRNSSGEEIIQNPAVFAAKVQTALVEDLRKMGLDIINFAVHNARAA